jgi:hypothetical protein
VEGLERQEVGKREGCEGWRLAVRGHTARAVCGLGRAWRPLSLNQLLLLPS